MCNGVEANVMNNCKIITSSKCDLNVISGQLREKFSDRRHVVVVAELLIAIGNVKIKSLELDN